MHRFVAMLAIAVVAIALGGVGCEALVSKDLPSFACEPGDLNACPDGQICSPNGVCVPSCPFTTCGEHLVCDPVLHLCVPDTDVPEGGARDSDTFDGTLVQDAPTDSTLPPVDSPFDTTSSTGAIGATCITAASCNSGLLCGDSSVLGDAVKTTGPLCTKPCCTSQDCPTAFVCYGPGTGGTYCVNPTLLPRANANGSAPGGTSCTTGDSCRSGLCAGATSMVCTDTCCSDADCASPALCRRTLVEGHNVFACAVPPAGTTGNDSTCVISSDCNSGICYGTEFAAECKPHCCGKTSCLAQRPPSSGYGTCAYLQTSGAPEYLGACLHDSEAPGGSPGPGEVGTACDPTQTINSDCKTSFCDTTTRLCTDVCCIDTDCAAYPGTTCKPASNPHFLTCQK